MCNCIGARVNIRAFKSGRIVAQVFLVSDKNNGDAGAKVSHLRKPFFSNVYQGVGRSDRETHDYDVSVGIRKRAQSFVIFLACRVP